MKFILLAFLIMNAIALPLKANQAEDEIGRLWDRVSDQFKADDLNGARFTLQRLVTENEALYGREDIRTIDTYVLLARMEMRLDLYEEAIWKLEFAVTQYSTGSQSSNLGFIEAASHLGFAYCNSGHLNECQFVSDLVRDAVSEADFLDVNILARINRYLALGYATLGDGDNFIGAAHSLLDLCRRDYQLSDEDIGVLEATLVAAIHYSPFEADVFYRKINACDVDLERLSDVSAIQLLAMLGQNRLEQSEPDDALKFLERLEVRLETLDKSSEFYWENVAQLIAAAAELKDASVLNRQIGKAMNVDRSVFLGFEDVYPILLNNIGMAFLYAGRLEQSANFLNGALAETEIIHGVGSYESLKIRQNLAYHASKSGNLKGAALIYEAVLIDWGRISYYSPEQLLSTKYDLGVVYLRLGEAVKAKKTLLDVLYLALKLGVDDHPISNADSNSSKLDFINLVRDRLISLALDQPSIDAELVAHVLLITKGIAGDAVLEANKAAFRNPEVADMILKIQEVESELSSQEYLGNEDKIQDLAIIRDQLRQSLFRSDTQLSKATDYPNFQSNRILDLLPIDAVFIDFGSFRMTKTNGNLSNDKHFVAVVYLGGDLEAYYLGPISDLEMEISRLGNLDELQMMDMCNVSGEVEQCFEDNNLLSIGYFGEKRDGEATIIAAQTRLGETLLGFVKNVDELDKIIISPDGILHQFNFAILFRDGSELFETHEIRIISSGRVITRDADVGASVDNILVVGIETFGPFSNIGVSNYGDCDSKNWVKVKLFCPLHYAEIEARRIAALAEESFVNVELVVSPDATESSLKAAMPGNSIIHLATHARINQGELTSSLNKVLIAAGNANQAAQNNAYEGVVSGREIGDLQLFGTKLVVLSACETGSGSLSSIEGPFSLAYAFRLAGVESVIMSLWKVDDQMTSEFMQIFYTNYFALLVEHKGLTKHALTRRSLRIAMLDAKEKNYPKRVYSAFVLIEN